jgi:hypothetical protein
VIITDGRSIILIDLEDERLKHEALDQANQWVNNHLTTIESLIIAKAVDGKELTYVSFSLEKSPSPQKYVDENIKNVLQKRLEFDSINVM